MEQDTWITRELLPRIVSLGVFGKKDDVLTKCDVEEKPLGEDHFTSGTFFISLQLFSGDKHKILVKLAPEDPEFRKEIGTELLYLYEKVFYTETLEELEMFVSKRGMTIKHLFPKCYYADNEEEKKEVVVLQDMRPLGFRTTTDLAVLDYDHCVVALRALGRFHAVSYAMKTLENETFVSLASKHRYQNIFYNPEDTWNETLRGTCYRALDYLERTQELSKNVLTSLRERLKTPMDLVLKLGKPSEPSAVLAHGDFCRNNLLFRYRDGSPCDVVMFDLQTVRYTSPILDLSFFFYLNTTAELRSAHFDSLLKEYQTAMITDLAKLLNCPAERVCQDYSLENLRREFAEHAMYGFIIVSDFLPTMMGGHEEDSEEGVRATKAIADVMKHVVWLEESLGS